MLKRSENISDIVFQDVRHGFVNGDLDRVAIAHHENDGFLWRAIRQST
jgi:hypothetical protein